MRRALSAGITGLALAVAFVAAVSGSAFAYFSTTGAGSASAGVSKLTTPTIASATPAVGGTVALSWAAVTAPDSDAVTYWVTRDGGKPAGNCPSSDSPATATTCTDGGLEVGTHSYVVTARWRSWTATSSTSTAKITIGAAHHFVLTAASSTPAAGAADNLTITAKDEKNSTVTTYTGSHNLTFSGALASPGGTVPTVSDSSGTAIAFGGTTAVNFSAGVASASGGANGVMTLYKSGATSVKVSDGTLSSTTALAVTVAAAPAVEFVLSASATTMAAAATVNLTTTAKDTYANIATSYAGLHDITFSGASASPSAAAPTVVNSTGTAVAFGAATALNFTAGAAAVSSSKNGLTKLNRAEVANITASDGSISTPVPLVVTVSPGTATKLAFSNVSISAGVLGSTCLFTCSVTGLGNSGTVNAKVNVTDSAGNTVSAIGSGHTVTVTATAGATIGGGTLAFSETGTAESTTQFTYTAKSSGAFADTITAKTTAGTTYTSATFTTSR